MTKYQKLQLTRYLQDRKLGYERMISNLKVPLVSIQEHLEEVNQILDWLVNMPTSD